MQKTVEPLRGDAPGTTHGLVVLRFAGASAEAPTAYLQAALHGDELPGVAALHFLIPRIAQAEREGKLLGAVTVVPYANPIASGQFMAGAHMGRFAFGSRTNFNRRFPMTERADGADLAREEEPIPAEARLKARLVALSLGHDIVLDLHCDSEGLSYLYIPFKLWPAMSDLATCLGSAAVLLWDDGSDGAFEAAALHAMTRRSDAPADWSRRAVSTVELRGQANVGPETAAADADGLYRFLVARGVIADPQAAPPEAWRGEAAPIWNVEMNRAPACGAILYHVRAGDRVAEGDLVAEILTAPGEEGGAVAVRAAQGGLVLTRRAHRLITPGDDLAKVIGARRAADGGTGTLED